jgi:hypothetical protein
VALGQAAFHFARGSIECDLVSRVALYRLRRYVLIVPEEIRRIVLAHRVEHPPCLVILRIAGQDHRPPQNGL